ncbi:hypothetical protein SAY87_004224 [Trapa incisa]|uniref:Uncharacterized protein n=1 Tax=Trapa incisa TaxID=236973 RepID=A0AAN7JPB3_9MYRT|nr:hypothetical protein SAY87_004224 [Trapa incisa]
MACPPDEHDGQTVRKSRASHIASCCGLMLQLRELPSTYGTWFLQIPPRPMNVQAEKTSIVGRACQCSLGEEALKGLKLASLQRMNGKRWIEWEKGIQICLCILYELQKQFRFETVSKTIHTCRYGFVVINWEILSGN